MSIKQHPSDHHRHKGDDPHDAIPFVLRSELDAVKASIQEYARNEKGRERPAKARVLVQNLTLAFLALTMSAGFWQACETGRAVDEARRSTDQAMQTFIDDKAPIVMQCEADDPETVTFDFTAGRPLRWRVRFLNFGESPALNLQIAAMAFRGKNAPQEAARFFATLPPRLLGISTVLQPNGTDCKRGKLTDAFSADLMTEDDKEKAATQDGWYVVATRFQYSDGFGGNLYNTDVCMMILATARVMDCPGLNRIYKVDATLKQRKPEG